MKKSVIFTIAVIYIIGIVIVGFLGQKLTVYDPKIDVENITCISDDYKAYNPKISKDKAWIDKGYVGYIEHTEYEEGMKILLKCRITPANATEQRLEYISNDTQCGTITYQEDGTAILNILKSGIFSVTIRSTDNKGTSIKIRIIVTNISDII